MQDELFLDRNGGGYFNTPGEDPSVLLRVKEDHDGAEPSGNSVSAINLIRLSSLVAGSRSENYRGTAEHLLVSSFSCNLDSWLMDNHVRLENSLYNLKKAFPVGHVSKHQKWIKLFGYNSCKIGIRPLFC